MRRTSFKSLFKTFLVSCVYIGVLVLLAFLSLSIVPAQGGNVEPEGTAKAPAPVTIEQTQIAIDCKTLKGMGTVYLVVAGKGYVAQISCGISI